MSAPTAYDVFALKPEWWQKMHETRRVNGLDH